MFKEIRDVRQEAKTGCRRWFESDGFELVVWQNAAGAFEGFQICYDFGRGERALTWRPEVGFEHNAVDGGDASPLANLTPILGAVTAVPWAEIEKRFGERAAGLEEELREMVGARLAARK